MKYPDDYINKVICGDCLEVMKGIPDNSVDLVLTDPPYGVEIDYGMTYMDTRKNLKNLIIKFMPELLRIGKVVMITCGIVNINLYPDYKWCLAWIYNTTNTTGKWGFTQWQPIIVYGKDPYLVNRKGRQLDVLRCSCSVAEKFNHPCPKPIEFWRRLILRGSLNENDIILDPFLGSGTTAVACKQLNRKYIGIEINPDYCRIAKERLMGISDNLPFKEKK